MTNYNIPSEFRQNIQYDFKMRFEKAWFDYLVERKNKDSNLLSTLLSGLDIPGLSLDLEGTTVKCPELSPLGDRGEFEINGVKLPVCLAVYPFFTELAISYYLVTQKGAKRIIEFKHTDCDRMDHIVLIPGIDTILFTWYQVSPEKQLYAHNIPISAAHFGHTIFDNFTDFLDTIESIYGDVVNENEEFCQGRKKVGLLPTTIRYVEEDGLRPREDAHPSVTSQHLDARFTSVDLFSYNPTLAREELGNMATAGQDLYDDLHALLVVKDYSHITDGRLTSDPLPPIFQMMNSAQQSPESVNVEEALEVLHELEKSNNEISSNTKFQEYRASLSKIDGDED